MTTLVLVLSSCGTAKTFKGTQLGGILLGSSDAPLGLQYIPQQSGPQTLQYISKDKTEDAKLTSDGLESVYSSFFGNAGAIAILSGQTQNADPNAKEIAMFGGVFKTAQGAHKALLLEHQSDLSAGSDIKTVLVEKVGDETLAESGTQPGIPFPGFLVYWREGNAIFGILVAGGPTAGVTLADARSLAVTVHVRAQKA